MAETRSPSPPPAPALGTTPAAAVTLWEARLGRGLTVVALAARAGVSEATIYRIARGATVPRPHVVRRLAAALGTAPGEIAEFRRDRARARRGRRGGGGHRSAG